MWAEATPLGSHASGRPAGAGLGTSRMSVVVEQEAGDAQPGRQVRKVAD